MRKRLYMLVVVAMLIFAASLVPAAACNDHNGHNDRHQNDDVKVIYVWVTKQPDRQLQNTIRDLSRHYTVEVHNVSVQHSYWWNIAYLGYGAQKYPSMTIVFNGQAPAGYTNSVNIPTNQTHYDDVIHVIHKGSPF